MQSDKAPSARHVLAYASPDAARPSPSIFQWIIGGLVEAALLTGAAFSTLDAVIEGNHTMVVLVIGLGGLAWGLYLSLVHRHREAALWMALIAMVLTALPALLALVFFCYERDRNSAMLPLGLSVALGVCAWQFYRWHCTLERVAAARASETDVGQQS